ncbi:uncharacterized protein UV8b_03396 [Ustilaginoidea virens]|uniref:Uncharacterized protein n=1 Tax=Ustilaginoidea virens TaxID=1159556 RepID=A0A8E5HPT4_USTVR|nr:uncharacterized protein UV8b_03396 [Ustilaginoidea virens]QUC19155.1 hypothetical protein UV8b_03396 [Ustilaginoidea virens]
MDIQHLPIPTPQRQVAVGREVVVPWTRQEIPLGTGFSSRRIATPNPWLTTSSPWDAQHLRAQKLLYEGAVEGKATYRDSESTSHSTGTEHTSGSLGATVGCAFLKASVTGSYDKTVLTTKDTNRVSRTCLMRHGAVRFGREPRLSWEAKALLSRPGGEALFAERFGDYYAACYVLGGDAGVYVSTSDEAVSTRSTEKVTVRVKALFFSTSRSFEKTTTGRAESFEVTMSGYDTLAGSAHVHVPTVGPSGLVRVSQAKFDEVRRASTGYVDSVDELPARIGRRMRELRLVKDRDELEWDHGLELCRAGLVVQLVLMPYSHLREYKVAVLGL